MTQLTESMARVGYKLFYFYLMPILVIPVGYIGWKRSEDYDWEKETGDEEGGLTLTQLVSENGGPTYTIKSPVDH